MTNGKRTIGKLAAEAGVGVETIRYYERRGLLRCASTRVRQLFTTCRRHNPHRRRLASRIKPDLVDLCAVRSRRLP